MASPDVMVVSQALDVQQAFAGRLAKSGLVPIVAAPGSEAEAILERHSVSLIWFSHGAFDHVLFPLNGN